MPLTIEALVEWFGLAPHPEGGFYSKTFRSTQEVAIKRQEDEAEVTKRPASTAIFFLILSQNVSPLHRIKSNECWHFYLGSPMTVVELDEAACACMLIELGNNDLLLANKSCNTLSRLACGLVVSLMAYVPLQAAAANPSCWWAA
jgi:predicted cupin superfamily sugar epimerase